MVMIHLRCQLDESYMNGKFTLKLPDDKQLTDVSRKSSLTVLRLHSRSGLEQDSDDLH